MDIGFLTISKFKSLFFVILSYAVKSIILVFGFIFAISLSNSQSCIGTFYSTVYNNQIKSIWIFTDIIYDKKGLVNPITEYPFSCNTSVNRVTISSSSSTTAIDL